MRVAYLGVKGLPSQSGAERVVEGIVQALRDRNELTVYCDSRYTAPDASLPGVRLIRLPTLPGKHFRAASLFVLSALHALLRGSYDLVHIHNAEACFIAPLVQLRFPVIATSHGQAYSRRKWGPIARKLIRLIDNAYGHFPQTLTSVSLPLCREYERRFGRTVHYTPNGVDAEVALDVSAASATLKANGVDGSFVLFAAGRVDPTKGCHLLLEAWRQARPSSQLVVVGDLSTLPSYSRQLKVMADGLPVRFVPFVRSKPELLGMLREASLFVFPSTVEAMSMMLLEAASLGAPIVCADIPENEAVLTGEHALFFRSGDVADLAAKLVYALEHPDEMRHRGLAARSWVASTFAWANIGLQYESLYQGLLRSHGAASPQPRSSSS